MLERKKRRLVDIATEQIKTPATLRSFHEIAIPNRAVKNPHIQIT